MATCSAENRRRFEGREREMSLALEELVDGDMAVVTCRGPIVSGTTARRFGACVARVLRRYRRVALDLGAVTDIDARGVGVLAGLIARAEAAERRLVLARSSDRAERILRLTGLDVLLHEPSPSRS